MATPPTHVGPYRIVRELGRGGMGVVWEARHPASARPLALKQVLGEVVDAEAVARFTREAEALARLRHPGVVAVHAFGTSEVGPYLVTDLVVGRDLKELARGGPLAPRRAAELVAGVADAVEVVHAHGLLHRDLKPGNVIVQEADGRPVLLDFGLARELDGSSLTRSGALVGTPGFMSPEQVDGRRDLDARSDVYGLGAVLFFLLAGRAPFEGSLVNIFRRVLSSTPEWPEGAPRDLLAITRRALEKERDARYPTAAALAEDLRRWLAGERPHAARGGGVRRATLAALLGLALLVAAAGGAAWWLRRDAGTRQGPVERATDPAPRPSTAPGPEDALAAARGRLRTLRSSRPGPGRLAAWRALVALSAGLPADEREALELEFAGYRGDPLLVEEPPRELPPAQRLVAAVGFGRPSAAADLRLGWGWRSGPGGRSLLVSSGELTEWAGAAPHELGVRAIVARPGTDGLLLIGGAFHLAARAGGARGADLCFSTAEAPRPGVDDLYAADVSPTGRHVAVGGAPGTVWHLDVGSFAVAERLESGLADDLAVESLAYSHDGRRLAVVRTESRSGGPRGRVDVWDLGAGGKAPAWSPVPETGARPRSAAFTRDGDLVVGFDGGHVWRHREGSEERERLLSDEGGLGGLDVVVVRVDRAGNPVVVTGVGNRESSGLLLTRDLPGQPGTCVVNQGSVGVGFTGMDLSDDESLVAAGDRDGVVTVWGWRLTPSGGPR